MSNATDTVVLLESRYGSSKKEGSNKDRNYVSYKVLFFDGLYSDFFCWDEPGRSYPKNLATPCLAECDFSRRSMDGKVTLELHGITKSSASFSFSKLFESLKLPMDKVVLK
jgi:hypothetical protein